VASVDSEVDPARASACPVVPDPLPYRGALPL
jgi:hypothetical protein